MTNNLVYLFNKDSNETLIEINLGADICRRLKQIYYPETDWNKCYKDIASKFSRIKESLRKFFPNLDPIELIEELKTFTDDDLMDCLEDEKK